MFYLEKEVLTLDKFFIEQNYGKDEILLFEKDGDFYDHSTQNLLIATFHNEEYAYKIRDLLNEKFQ